MKLKEVLDKTVGIPVHRIGVRRKKIKKHPINPIQAVTPKEDK